MKPILSAALLALSFAIQSPAHRMDEYLQATLISIGQDRVEVEINLTPGVAVLPVVLAMIDKDGDGHLSSEEQRGYANQILRGLTLERGSEPLALSVVDIAFPSVERLREGLGSIQLKLRAELPKSRRGPSKLHFRNLHAPDISVYLVNCLLPVGGGLEIVRQSRDLLQSEIRVDYSFGSGVPPVALSIGMRAMIFAAMMAGLYIGWETRRSRMSLTSF